MKPKTISLTGSGAGVTNSAPVPTNWRDNRIALYFTTDGSTTGFTVQYTQTDPNDYASADDWKAADVWINHGNLASMTADEENNLTDPVRGIRLQADASGTDTGTLTMIQAQN